MHRQGGSLIHGQASDFLSVSSFDLPDWVESLGPPGPSKRGTLQVGIEHRRY